MNISYCDPLSKAWYRMKKALFQPFDISKWFTVGFTAFLATLMSGFGNPGGSANYSQRNSLNGFDWEEFIEWPNTAWYWLNTHPFWFTFILFATIFLIAVFIVLKWISSRGKFMFIDNVVHDKSEVIAPWNEFQKEGNSLFIWRLVYGIICTILILFSLFVAFLIIVEVLTGNPSVTTKVYLIAGIIFEFFFLMISISYISMLLNNFIVPIMYKHRLNTTQSWLKFLPVFFSNFWDFIVYGLFVFVLIILTVFGIIFFGIFTCCIGFLLLILPYIGAVVLLPVTYTFRSFSIEFFEQYGEEFKVFRSKEATTEQISD